MLSTLREKLGLIGTKRSCENGDCGACTVLINGEPSHSCLSLAVEVVNLPITTIEGLLDSPVRTAFVDKWAIQCGFCTPGFIVNCHALLTNHPNAKGESLEEWLQSNTCRYTGYQEIKDVVNSLIVSSDCSINKTHPGLSK